jgi:hypothetical protein
MLALRAAHRPAHAYDLADFGFARPVWTPPSREAGWSG